MRRASPPATWWPRARSAFLGPVAMILLALTVYAPGLGASRMPISFDTVAFFYPLRHYLAIAWQQGRVLPMWTSSVFMGAPFLANVQNAVLYPPSLIYAFLPTDRALALSMVLHVGIGGAGMYLYAYRGLNLRTAGSAVTALIYMLGPYLTAHLTHLNQNNTLAWTPWLMLVADRTTARPRRRLVALTALVVALAFLAGHTQQFYFSLLLGLLAVATRLLRIPHLRLRPAAIGVGSVLAGMAVGLSLSGLQLIPTIELAGQSVRSGGLDLASAGFISLPLKGVMGSMMPKYSIELPTEYAGASVGAVALALASLAVLSRWRRRFVLLWAAIFVLAIWAATGPTGRLYDAFYYGLPGLSLFRVPSRLLLFSTVAAAILAGVGVRTACQLAAASRRPGWRRRTWRIVAPATAVALLLPVAAVADQLRAGRLPRVLRMFPHQVGSQDIVMTAGFVLLAGLVVTVGVMVGHRHRAAMVGAGLIGVTLLDVLLATGSIASRHPLPVALLTLRPPASRLLSAGPNSRYLSLYRPPPSFHAIFAGPIPAPADRVKFEEAMRVVEVLRPDVAMNDGPLSADGYDGGILPLRAYNEFRKPVLGPSATAPPDFTIHDLIDRVSDPAWLREAGVSIVLTNVGTYPAATDCGCFSLSGTAEGVNAWTLSDSTPTRAWVEGSQGWRPASILADTGEQVDIRLPDQAGGGTLVLADAAYPGWEATVDGRQAPIQLRDGFLRAVQIPAGASHVTFRFRPASLWIGLAVSVIGILMLALLLFPRRSGR